MLLSPFAKHAQKVCDIVSAKNFQSEETVVTNNFGKSLSAAKRYREALTFDQLWTATEYRTGSPTLFLKRQH